MFERLDSTKSSSTETYRYIISLNKKRLFFLSLSTAAAVIIIFFVGYLTGATGEKTPSYEEQVSTAESNVIVNTEELPSSANITAEKKAATTDDFNELLPNAVSPNKTSDFNTNDLVFDNIFSDEQLSKELIESAKTQDNDRYNQPSKKTVPAKNTVPPPSSKRDLKSTQQKKSPIPPTSKALAAASISSKQANSKTDSAVPRVNKRTGASKVSTRPSVSKKTPLQSTYQTVYEEYPEVGKTYYYLQLMTTGDVVKGRQFSARLRNEGFLTKLVETTINDSNHYVILIGLYKNKAYAIKDLSRFKTARRYGKAFKDAFLRPYNAKPNESRAGTPVGYNTSTQNSRAVPVSSGQEAVFNNNTSDGEVFDEKSGVQRQSNQAFSANRVSTPKKPAAIDDLFSDPSLY
ncbi:hypothetical protein COTS27_00629 [Spirochaetota bacterium]|nr:hypothetical protein COTS27_00629 [Spirochaetota bacterium]